MKTLRICAAAAIVFGCLAVVARTDARAQEVTIGELSRRVAGIESEKLGDRMARIETMQQQNNTLLQALLVAVAIQLVERALKIGLDKKRSS